MSLFFKKFLISLLVSFNLINPTSYPKNEIQKESTNHTSFVNDESKNKQQEQQKQQEKEGSIKVNIENSLQKKKTSYLKNQKQKNNKKTPNQIVIKKSKKQKEVSNTINVTRIKESENRKKDNFFSNNEESVLSGYAKCGNSHHEILEDFPINLCLNGKASEVVQDGAYFRWKCETDFDTEHCSAFRKVDGECLYKEGEEGVLLNFDKSLLCKEGVLSDLHHDKKDYGRIFYSCEGTTKGSVSVGCSAFIKTDGKCGKIKDNGDYCLRGKMSNLEHLSGNHYSWYCNGLHGGRHKYCTGDKSLSNASNEDIRCNSYGFIGACAQA